MQELRKLRNPGIDTELCLLLTKSKSAGGPLDFDLLMREYRIPQTTISQGKAVFVVGKAKLYRECCCCS